MTLSDKILSKIEHEHINPKTKYYFVINNILKYILFIFLFFLVWISFWHLIAFLIEVNTTEANPFLFIQLPIILSMICLTCLSLILYLFSSFDKTYKISKFISYPFIFFSIIIFGFLWLKLNFIDFIEEHWPAPFHFREQIWNNPWNWLFIWETIKDLNLELKPNFIEIQDRTWKVIKLCIDNNTQIFWQNFHINNLIIEKGTLMRISLDNKIPNCAKNIRLWNKEMFHSMNEICSSNINWTCNK